MTPPSTKQQQQQQQRLEFQKDINSHSIFISRIPDETTPDEIESFFHSTGTINRVTILYDHQTGKPKGYAYVEYQDSQGSQNAIEQLNGQMFKGKQLKVQAKRMNLPGFGRSGSRGTGGGGGGGGGGGFRSGKGDGKGDGKRGGMVQEKAEVE